MLVGTFNLLKSFFLAGKTQKVRSSYNIASVQVIGLYNKNCITIKFLNIINIVTF